MHIELTNPLGVTILMAKPFEAHPEEKRGGADNFSNSILFTNHGETTRVRETPAEIAAKIEAKERKTFVERYIERHWKPYENDGAFPEVFREACAAYDGIRFYLNREKNAAPAPSATPVGGEGGEADGQHP